MSSQILKNSFKQLQKKIFNPLRKKIYNPFNRFKKKFAIRSGETFKTKRFKFSKPIHSVLNETTELGKLFLMETEAAPPFFLAVRDDDTLAHETGLVLTSISRSSTLLMVNEAARQTPVSSPEAHETDQGTVFFTIRYNNKY